MEFHRYDIIEADLKNKSGSSIQKKRRPYIIVSNEKGTSNASFITVMPLTHILKKKHLPVHECLNAVNETGLTTYSMILGEMPQTIDKEDVIRKLGTVTDINQRNNVNKVCFNTFFFGENINWEDVLV